MTRSSTAATDTDTSPVRNNSAIWEHALLRIASTGTVPIGGASALRSSSSLTFGSSGTYRSSLPSRADSTEPSLISRHPAGLHRGTQFVPVGPVLDYLPVGHAQPVRLGGGEPPAGRRERLRGAGVLV